MALSPKKPPKGQSATQCAVVLATLPCNVSGRSGGRSGRGCSKVGMLTAFDGDGLPEDTAAWRPAANRLQPVTLTLRSTQHSGRAHAKS
eukprot:357120-Chlamydomonas_euryale.AAC.6